VVVVFAAAVFVLQAAVALDAQLDVPPASEQERERERDVPQAAQSVAQADPQDARLVLAALLADHSDVSLADPQDAHLVSAYSSAVHSASPLAVRSDVSPDDPLAGPQDDCWAARSADGHC
jgi:hypothetical protein